MKIEEILNEENIIYKTQEYDDNTKIYKIGYSKKINIVTIKEKGNVFKLNIDLFYYLDNQKDLYSFLLTDLDKNQSYYLEFKEKNNWIKSSFERSRKEEIYFGKIVLNNRINMNGLKNKLKYYK